MVQLLEGAPVAKRIRDEARAAAAALSPPPSLVVILLGNDPASETYVSSKTRAAGEAGIRADTVRLPSGTSPEALLEAVAAANRDPAVDGVLVQMPLEAGHDPARVIDALDPGKDVDGLHPENVGLLHQGRPRFLPCTPAGIVALLDHYGVALSGRRAVILGRSALVGRPLAALLTARDATVTLCHSRTRDLPAVCREGEILVAAIGRPGFVTAEFVQPGATVVDVGINRLLSIEDLPGNLRRSERIVDAIGSRGHAIVGDVDFDDVSRIAARITPVPGGVGPLTVAMLIHNTVLAARVRRRPGVQRTS
ncbi:MAG TPA: bifunctional 5,10-methylenetetrahydrofolate dehydrogenase/5,10-methenyltetrahydrofolate cyclohydrolase [Thermoanaerobaculia bacterium]|jgi:methylenetetrahydrofolate dehydrogenase (NADP+)/methenyltetrahydrofolate cyclohydrolase|nr:bifunctional 5,10-methylenetetrahydrofolate dehydrogenase/5,10-methenyltetrahydrofolate cyclohydrolase [Thermoanaerobaculia bacterium]